MLCYSPSDVSLTAMHLHAFLLRSHVRRCSLKYVFLKLLKILGKHRTPQVDASVYLQVLYDICNFWFRFCFNFCFCFFLCFLRVYIYVYICFQISSTRKYKKRTFIETKTGKNIFGWKNISKLGFLLISKIQTTTVSQKILK